MKSEKREKKENKKQIKNELSSEVVQIENKDVQKENNNKCGFKFTRKHQIIILSILSLFIVFFIIIKIVNVIQKEYESPIKEYYKGLEQLDVNRMLNAYPEELKESKRALTEEKINLLRNVSDGSFTLIYDIKKEQELSELELKNLVNELNKEYNKTYDIKKGYKVTVESTLNYKETENITIKKMDVIQIGWNWYIWE